MNKSNPYINDPPIMIPSFVCYADILGYTQLSNEFLKSKNGDHFLLRLRTALSKSYARIRERSKGWGDNELFSIKVFTDNIVVGYPLPHFHNNYGEGELGYMFSIFSEFQIGLALEGFLIRGGIAFGEHYMDSEIVFGDALLDAIEQDKYGGPPCISLAPSAVKVLQRHLGFYAKNYWAPQHQDLLQDSDGSIFLNYLDEAFIAYPEGGILFELIKGHMDTIVDGLTKYKSNPGIRSKYEWAARYHNFVCKEFAENNQVPYGPDADEMLAAAAREAQKLINYQINIESLAAMPSRIKINPIKPNE